MPTSLKFNSSKSLFLTTTIRRVNKYFKDSGRSKNANPAMWFKTFLFLGSFIGLYAAIISNQFSAAFLLPLSIALGIASAFVGFNICHDAIHGSFSDNANVNKVFSLLFNFVGANPYVWSISHNIAHHNFTNIPGHDEDIEIAPGLIRISNEGTVNKLQRFQHWYAFPLYSLASISWVFRKDYLKFFQDNIGGHESNHPRIEYFNLFFYKAVYYFLFIVLPMMVLDVAWWQVIVGFLALHFAQGITMGLVFQLAHVVEGTDFPVPNDSGNIEEAWAEHQMRTTANFATSSKVASFFLGGLNRQIEHHLFPKICHIHYPEIGKIVRQTALEFNIPYIENPTFAGALHSHYKMLRKFGAEAV